MNDVTVLNAPLDLVGPELLASSRNSDMFREKGTKMYLNISEMTGAIYIF